MKSLVVSLAAALCFISQTSSGQQDARPKNDKFSELVERQRAIEVAISAGGGNFGHVRESFKVGEPITVVVFMTNKGVEATEVVIADTYYQNRPKLMKDGHEIPYRKEVAEVLKWKDKEGCGAGRVIWAELKPNEKTEVDFFMVNEGARITGNIIWYDTLEPGKYDLSIRRRFGCYQGPEAESDAFHFEVVSDNHAAPDNGMQRTRPTAPPSLGDAWAARR